MARDVVPIFAGDYVEILHGFLSTRIERISPRKWRVRDSGELRTIRFDDTDLGVDMQRSTGVAGFSRHQGSLYIHLDNGSLSEIILTKSSPTSPYLHTANGRIRSWRSNGSGAEFTLYTMDEVSFVIGGLKKDRRYRVEMAGKRHDVESTADGKLVFEKDILGNAFEEIRIKLAKAKEGHPR